MEDKKNILLHLYGESDAEGSLRSFLQDEELRGEHQALSEARFKIDLLPRQKPDSAVIDSIVAEARRSAGGPVSTGRRTDRPPIWRIRSIRRVMIPAITIAAMVVFAVSYGLYQIIPLGGHVLDDTLVRSESILTPAESLLRPTPVPPGLAEQIANFDSDPELAWDDARNVRQLYRRIESLRPANDLDWDERAMPLERIPTQGAINPNLQRAATRQR
jgi:hypothetical protein